MKGIHGKIICMVCLPATKTYSRAASPQCTWRRERSGGSSLFPPLSSFRPSLSPLFTRRQTQSLPSSLSLPNSSSFVVLWKENLINTQYSAVTNWQCIDLELLESALLLDFPIVSVELLGNGHNIRSEQNLKTESPKLTPVGLDLFDSAHHYHFANIQATSRVHISRTIAESSCKPSISPFLPSISLKLFILVLFHDVKAPRSPNRKIAQSLFLFFLFKTACGACGGLFYNDPGLILAFKSATLSPFRTQYESDWWLNPT